MDKNFEISLEVMVTEEHRWQDLGVARTKIMLPLNHIPSMSFEKLIHEMIDEAYAKYQQKALERENSEKDSASTDEE